MTLRNQLADVPADTPLSAGKLLQALGDRVHAASYTQKLTGHSKILPEVYAGYAFTGLPVNHGPPFLQPPQHPDPRRTT